MTGGERGRSADTQGCRNCNETQMSTITANKDRREDAEEAKTKEEAKQKLQEATKQHHTETVMMKE